MCTLPEKDFRRILNSDVEISFKIAMSICAELGWRIEFDYFRDLRYSLIIPLKAQVSQPNEDFEDDEEEGVKEENYQRHEIPGPSERCVS